MTTTQKLPVSYGTKITVTCPEGHPNMGNDVIICSGGANYRYHTEPMCKPGMSKSDIYS